MIIFTDRTGQLGNQLFEFSTFIANALANDSKLTNLFFTDYEEYFIGPSIQNKLPSIRTSLGNSLLNKLARKLLRSPLIHRLATIFNLMVRGNGEPFDIHMIDSRGFVFLKSGAWFTDFKNFYKYELEIKTYFTPISKYANNITTFIDSCRSNHEILIGVHIRSGDYRDFLGGKFYFEKEVYLDKIIQTAKLFPNKKLCFIICSNEIIDLSYFNPISVYSGLGHFIEDMYTLAQCDYILGPPSTYTMWASFYGNKPLLKIINSDQIIKMSDFKIDFGY